MDRPGIVKHLVQDTKPHLDWRRLQQFVNVAMYFQVLVNRGGKAVLECLLGGLYAIPLRNVIDLKPLSEPCFSLWVGIDNHTYITDIYDLGAVRARPLMSR